MNFTFYVLMLCICPISTGTGKCTILVNSNKTVILKDQSHCYVRTLEACSEETQNEVASRGEAWLEEIALGISYVSPLPVTSIAFNASFPTKPSIEGIICEEGKE